MNLIDRVINYVHSIEDQACLAEMLSPAIAEELESVLFQLLDSGKPDAVYAATLCIQDAHTVAPQYNLGADFIKNFPASRVWQKLDELVSYPDFRIRCHAISTIGRSGLTASLPALTRYFDAALGRDPLILSRLLFEISWLNRKERESRLNQLCAHENYLTRWASLAYIDSCSNRGPDRERLLTLAHDSSTHIKSEAEYLLHISEKKKAKAKKDGNAGRAPIVSEPAVRFHDLEIWAGNQIHNSDIADYTVEWLHTFFVTEVPKFIQQRLDFWERNR